MARIIAQSGSVDIDAEIGAVTLVSFAEGRLVTQAANGDLFEYTGDFAFKGTQPVGNITRIDSVSSNGVSLYSISDIALSFAAALNGSGGDDSRALDALLFQASALDFTGGAGNDVMRGGAFADTLTGGAGNDSLFGGAGNDVIDGGAGDDVIELGSGVDTLVLTSNSGNDVVNGFGDDDKVDLSALFANASPDVDQVLSPNEGLRITIGNVSLFLRGVTEELSRSAFTLPTQTGASAFADTLAGSSGSDSIAARGGNDSISGMDGADTLAGEAGNDTLDGGDGNDVLNGGSGNDSLIGGAGSDTVILTGALNSYTVTAVMNGVVALSGSDGLDRLSGIETLAFADGVTRSLPADVLRYIASNEDLIPVFGTNEVAALNHWLRNGFVEGRSLTAFDPAKYLELNPDLKAAFGNDLNAATRHYLTYGQAEGRGRFITGTEAAETLTGTAGSDWIEALGGNDLVQGANGNDTLVGGYGNDTLAGGAGDDRLEGGNGEDLAIIDLSTATSGQTLRLGGTQSSSMLTSQEILLTTSQGTDRLFGIEKISITGSAQADTISLANIAGTVAGGAGNDVLSYINPRDFAGNIGYLEGGEGDDTLIGDASIAFSAGQNGQVPVVFGGPVAIYDLSKATPGQQLIYTLIENGNGGYQARVTSDSLGTDSLLGIGSLSVTGSAGNDTIIGGSGMNTLHGGAGDDSLRGGLDIDLLEGGAGNDTLDGGGNGAQSSNTNTGVFNLSAATSGEEFRVSFSGDPLFGNGTVITKALGTDTLLNINQFQITGSSFNDTLIGGALWDTIEGGAGDDVIDGGEGVDIALFNFSSSLVALSGSNVSIADTNQASFTIRSALLGTDTLTGIEGLQITGSRFADEWQWSGPMGITVSGGDGNDTLGGGDGDDRLHGDEGADLIRGGAGNDTLSGSSADRDIVDNDNDTLIGGSGNDYIFVTGGNDVVDGGEGYDTVSFDFTLAGTGLNITLTTQGATTSAAVSGLGTSTATNVELFEVGGSYYNDSIMGSDGNDQIYAWFGDDTVMAGAGNDMIYGREGNDSIDGGVGDDTMRGSSGRDTLTGGAGNDAFFFFDRTYYVAGHIEDSIDTITDFGMGDNIQVGTGSGYVSFTSVTAGNGSTLTRGQAQLQADGTDTLLHIGTDANAGSDITIRLTGQYSPSQIVASGGVLTYRPSSTISGTPNNDSLTGAAGNDTIDGLAGNDTINGLDGDDSLIGGDGDDTLNGGAGNDTLVAGAGNGSLSGGDGDDTIFLSGQTGNQNISGGAGYDVLKLDFAAGTRGVWSVTTGGPDNLIGQVGFYYSSAIQSQMRDIDETIERADFTDGSIHYLRASVVGDTITGPADARSVVTDSAADNLIRTGALADMVSIRRGNDTVETGDGDDFIYAFIGGQDILNGGGGSDSLTIRDNSLSGLSYSFSASGNTIMEAAGSVVQFTNFEYVRVEGGGLNDLIDLRGLEDPSLGVVVLSGGAGNDTLIGSARADNLQGGIGADTMTGGAGNDVFEIDTFVYASGATDNTVAAPDTITDFSVGDIIRIFGLTLTSIAAGDGSGLTAGQVAVSVASDATTLYIGTNTTAGADMAVRLSGTFSAEQFQFNNNQISLQALTGIVGTSGDDNLVGTPDGEKIYGLAGNDTLQGLGGDDTLDGGTGDDSLDGGAGNDQFFWSQGNDTFIGGEGYDVVISDMPASQVDVGRNVWNYSEGYFNGLLLYTYSSSAGPRSARVDMSVERIELSDASVVIHPSGGDGGDTITLLNGVMNAYNAGAGNDTVLGGDMRDIIGGGLGSDSISAGGGDDIIISGYIDNDIIDGGDGFDTLITGSYFSSTLGSNVTISDNLISDAASGKTITISSIEKVNFSGGQGNDTIIGSNRSDSIMGYSGDDSINGGAGNDTLAGYDGNDTLTGGDGSDVFQFYGVNNIIHDRVTDFGIGDVLLIYTSVNSGSVVSGNGTDTLRGQVQLQVQNGISTLFIGSDDNPGAEITIDLVGIYTPGNFLLSGSQIDWQSAG